ncbi:unnamed protein product [Owenia fusiformis]|uniref:Uncharacterized protein n=1 Tax=Owenia fusiformis TaxID=6347 RepID=A0A8J1TFB7_OWEFU|nr:unnamed protein product [Owenia fusiformis]
MANETSPAEVYVHFLQTHPVETSILIAFLLVLTTIGVFGNILIIGAVSVTKGLQTVANVFVVNLAICDIILAGWVNAFFAAGAFLGEKWFLDRKALCDIVSFFCLSACLCSLATVAAIAVNRYVCICRPSIYPKMYSKLNTAIMIIIMWVYSCWLNIGALNGFGKFTYDKKMLGCIWDRNANRLFTVFFLLGVFIPVGIVATSYALIFVKVYTSKKKVAGESKKGNDSNMTKEIKLAKVLFGLFVVFLLMNSPYGVALIFDPSDIFPTVIWTLVVQLMHANGSGVNCFVYGFSNKAFNEGYKNFCWRILGLCGVKRPIKKRDPRESSTGTMATAATSVTHG